MKEDFQTQEVSKYADAIYNWLTAKLTEVIITKLWLEETYIDDEWKKMPMDFDYAFRLLKDAWYTLNHIIKEDWWKAKMIIKFFKIEDEVVYDIKTTYSISLTK